jgi:hypothetical protein
MFRHFLWAPLALLLGACAATPTLVEHSPAPEPIKDADAVPIGDILATIYTYPTGRFDPRWLEAARVTDAKLSAALPAGDFAHLKAGKSLNPNAFTALGPQPIQDGVDLNSGRVNDIVVSPQPLIAGDPNSYRAFIASDGGGVWRSDNCCSPATTFEPVTDSPEIEAIAIGDLEIDPNNPQVIYAGTGDLRFGSWSFGSSGVLKSEDGGDSWRVLGRDVFLPNYPANLSVFSQYQAVGKVVVDPNDSNRVAVGTKTGLYFSYDAGASWAGPCLTNAYGPTSSNPHRQDITGLLALDFAGSTTLIAAVGTRGTATPVQPDLDMNGANGIYRAAMPVSGCPANWQLISRADNGWPADLGNGAGLGTIGRIELAAAPSNPNVLYAEAIASQGFAIQGVWRSSDAGNTWQLRALPENFQGCPPGTQNWYNAGITVSPANPDDVVLSAWWTYRSIDGGASFTNLLCNGDQSRVHIDQHARAFVGGDPDRLLIGNDGGVYYSGNATLTTPNFTPLNLSVNTIEFYSGDLIANFDTASPRVLIGGAQDNGTSALVQFSDEGFPDVWSRIYGGDGVTTRIEPVFSQRVYMSSQRGNIVASINGVNAPEQNASGGWSPGEEGGDRKSFLMPFDLYKFGATDVADSGCTGIQGCNHLIAGTYRVWESTNGATGGSANARWSAISPDLTKNNLVVGSDNRSVIQSLRFAVSTRRTAIVGTLDGNVWYGFALGSGAANWHNVTGSNAVLPNRPILGVATDPQTPTIGYAAVAGFGANTPSTPGHVYQVRCNADCSSFQWRNVSGNLPDVPVNAVMVNPWIPTQVFAGSDWGLYYTDNVEAEQPIWKLFRGLPRAMIWDMEIDRGFTTLALFTRSRGAWVWPLPRALGQPNLTGLWTAAGEDGWGLSMAHQGNVLAPAWYTYDANGRPAWMLISGAALQADGSYTGDVYRFTGTPLAQINGQVANDPGVLVGNARFTPQADDRLRFDYTVDGVSQSKIVNRVAPGPIPACQFVEGSRASAGNHTDLWWNASESGWGMHLTEAGNLIFVAWYTYAADRQPMWITAVLQKQADGSFRGALNRPNAGTPFVQINGSPATSFPVPEVGTATLSFVDGEHAVFGYTVDGVSQQKSIERLLYAGPAQSVCQ